MIFARGICRDKTGAFGGLCCIFQTEQVSGFTWDLVRRILLRVCGLSDISDASYLPIVVCEQTEPPGTLVELLVTLSLFEKIVLLETLPCR